MIAAVLQLQLQKIKRNKFTFFLLIALSGVVIWFGNYHDRGAGHKNLVQALAYLFAMWLCSFCIDLYAHKKPAMETFPVRKPVQESLIVSVCLLLGAAFLLVRFMGSTPWEKMHVAYRISIGLGMLLFMYPIVASIIMLIKGYRLKDLGFRFKGFIPAIVVIIITAGTSVIAAPGRFTLQVVLQESGGVAGALLEGFVYAALAEEVTRMLLQTRLGAALKNTGIGWFIASLAWALMHGPNWWNQSRDVTETVLSCIRIVPLGLMWGYVTHRTKSILPSILAHGLNVWGLQNF